MDLEIESLTVVKLKEELKKLGFTGGGRLKKAELVTTLRELRAKANKPIAAEAPSEAEPAPESLPSSSSAPTTEEKEPPAEEDVVDVPAPKSTRKGRAAPKATKKAAKPEPEAELAEEEEKPAEAVADEKPAEEAPQSEQEQAEVPAAAAASAAERAPPAKEVLVSAAEAVAPVEPVVDSEPMETEEEAPMAVELPVASRSAGPAKAAAEKPKAVVVKEVEMEEADEQVDFEDDAVMVEPEKVPEKKEPEKKKPESSRGKAPAAAKEVAQEAAKDGGAGDKKKGSARVEEASHRGNGQKRREPESDSLQAKAEKDERKRPKHEPIPAFPAKLAAASKKPEPREARDSKRPEAAAKAPVPEVARGSAHSRLSGAEKSREPASRALVIEGLKRPFSIVTLKNFLGETGTVEGFELTDRRDRCYVIFTNAEDAAKTLVKLDGLVWPDPGKERLKPRVISEADAKEFIDSKTNGGRPAIAGVAAASAAAADAARRNLVRGASGTLKGAGGSGEGSKDLRAILDQKRAERAAPAPAAAAPAPLALDELFRKTKTKPCLYWLPVTDEVVKERRAKEALVLAAAAEASAAAKKLPAVDGDRGRDRDRRRDR